MPDFSTELTEQQISLLQEIYEESLGEMAIYLDVKKILEKLSLNGSEFIQCIKTLVLKNFIETEKGSDKIRITKKGIKLVEPLLLGSLHINDTEIYPDSKANRKMIFISHINEDKSLAISLKELLEQAFNKDFDIFVSSDLKSIRFGIEWFTEIKKALLASQVAIILCSPISIERPWINFEAGAACILGKPVIPICYDDLVPEKLPSPLNLMRGATADNIQEIQEIISQIGEDVQITPQIIDIEGSEYYRTLMDRMVERPQAIAITSILAHPVIHRGEDQLISGTVTEYVENVNIRIFNLTNLLFPIKELKVPVKSDNTYGVIIDTHEFHNGQYGVTIETSSGVWTKLTFLVEE